MHKNLCTGCGLIILDRYLLCIDDQLWHEQCVMCAVCRRPLDGVCQVRNGQLYCKYDYLLMFGVRCAGCNQPIMPHHLVFHLPVDPAYNNTRQFASAPAKADPESDIGRTVDMKPETRYFHQLCFICSECGHPLCPGEPYALRGSLPLCWFDHQRDLDECEQADKGQSHTYLSWEQQQQQQQQQLVPCVLNQSAASHLAGTDFAGPPHCDDLQEVTPARLAFLSGLNRQESECMIDDALGMTDGLQSYAASSDESSKELADPAEEDDLFELDSDSGSGKNSKRPRTILTTSQRRRFKAVFEISPKPVRKIREALAAETGLNIRVVQVWFQNQRAKVKKIARRQAQETAQQLNRRSCSFRSLEPQPNVVVSQCEQFNGDSNQGHVRFQQELVRIHQLTSIVPKMTNGSPSVPFLPSLHPSKSSVPQLSITSKSTGHSVISSPNAVSINFMQTLNQPPFGVDGKLTTLHELMRNQSIEIPDSGRAVITNSLLTSSSTIFPQFLKQQRSTPPSSPQTADAPITCSPDLTVSPRPGDSSCIPSKIESGMNDPIDKLFSMQHSYLI